MLWDEKVVTDNAAVKTADLATEANSEQRVLDYTSALREALILKMEEDKSVFLLGQGVDDPGGMFGVTKDMHKQFGRERSFDTPVSEEGMMGICAGAAMTGSRPVYFHNRPDFLLLALNQLLNHAAKIHFMDNGKTTVPMVVWSAIGRGWGSGPQHSQPIQALLMHLPGIKVVMPSTPYDAKGLMISAIEDKNPVVIIEHRWSMKRKGHVPEGKYYVPIGKGVYRTRGNDVTIVASSQMLDLALDAQGKLQAEGISVEIIDLRTIKPLDEDIILESVEKTGRLLVLDTGWQIAGVCAEVARIVSEKAFYSLKAPIQTLALPDVPVPAGNILEEYFFPTVDQVIEKVNNLIKA